MRASKALVALASFLAITVFWPGVARAELSVSARDALPVDSDALWRHLDTAKDRTLYVIAADERGDVVDVAMFADGMVDVVLITFRKGGAGFDPLLAAKDVVDREASRRGAKPVRMQYCPAQTEIDGAPPDARPLSQVPVPAGAQGADVTGTLKAVRLYDRVSRLEIARVFGTGFKVYAGGRDVFLPAFYVDVPYRPWLVGGKTPDWYTRAVDAVLKHLRAGRFVTDHPEDFKVLNARGDTLAFSARMWAIDPGCKEPQWPGQASPLPQQVTPKPVVQEPQQQVPPPRLEDLQKPYGGPAWSSGTPTGGPATARQPAPPTSTPPGPVGTGPEEYVPAPVARPPEQETGMSRLQAVLLVAGRLGLDAEAARMSDEEARMALAAFADANAVPGQHLRLVAAAVQHGILIGYDEGGIRYLGLDRPVSQEEWRLMFERSTQVSEGQQKGSTNPSRNEEAIDITVLWMRLPWQRMAAAAALLLALLAIPVWLWRRYWPPV